MSYLRRIITRQEWLDGIYRKGKSENSLGVAKSALQSFERFCEQTFKRRLDVIVGDLGNSPIDNVYVLLNDFASHLDQINRSPVTIKQYVSYVRSFLRSQGIKTTVEDTKENVQIPRQVREFRKPVTKDIIKIILDNSKEKRKALYLTLLSSGMRLGEALSLRKCDLEFTESTVKITINPQNTKTRQGRETFASREAREIILRLVSNLDQNELVFTRTANLVKAVSEECKVFAYIRKKCGLTEKYHDGKRSVATIHAFRAYFYTIASNALGDDYAHALLGHGSYLAQYYRQSSEERLKMYSQLEPHLLIYSNQTSIDEHEKNKKIIDLEEKIEKLTAEHHNGKKLIEQMQVEINQLVKCNATITKVADYWRSQTPINDETRKLIEKNEKAKTPEQIEKIFDKIRQVGDKKIKMLDNIRTGSKETLSHQDNRTLF